MDRYTEIFKNKDRILIFTAHPDDAEINAGGLIARLINDKKVVKLVVVTDGSNGNKADYSINKKEFAETRFQSQIDGAISLGLQTQNIVNLGIEDGHVENDIESIKLFVKHVRDFMPEIIITHAPNSAIIKFRNGVFWANHRDHRNVAQNVIDAVYPYARDANFFPELINEGFQPHIVEELLFFEQFGRENEVFVDISGFSNSKLQALQMHMKGGVLADRDIKVFMSENKIAEKFYERFGYVKINRLNTLN